MQLSDHLADEYSIETPESVAFAYDVAGLGTRALGAFIDTVAVFLLYLAVDAAFVAWVLRQEPNAMRAEPTTWAYYLVAALVALLHFAILFGYYMAFEMAWNGQTPGKRLVGTRVVRLDGSPASALAFAIRNLLRLIDFFPMGYALGVTVAFFDARARRLGDLAAGTLLIRVGKRVALDSLATTEPPAMTAAQHERLDRLAQDYYRLRSFGPREHDLVQDALNRWQRHAIDDYLLDRLALALANQLDGPPPGNARQFLLDLIAYHRRPAPASASSPGKAAGDA